MSKRVQIKYPVGGTTADIMFVGEAPGVEEVWEGEPFVGASGRFLNHMAYKVGIYRDDIAITNVFTERPPKNKVEHFFIKKTEASKSEDAEWYKSSPYPPFGSRGLVRKEYASELERLKREVEAVNPRVIVAFGATALWALTGQDKISKHRGTISESTLCPGRKVIATWHPAYILRGNYSEKPNVQQDLDKAKAESAFSEIRYEQREVWIAPDLGDLKEFGEKYLEGADVIAYDVETDPARGLLLCVCLAPSANHSLVVPFLDKTKPGWSYWGSVSEELAAKNWVQHWLTRPGVRKLAHNSQYDIMWLWRDGIEVRGELEDTMILHHSLQPEKRKDLGTLGSLYVSERAWKDLAPWADKKKDG